MRSNFKFWRYIPDKILIVTIIIGNRTSIFFINNTGHIFVQLSSLSSNVSRTSAKIFRFRFSFHFSFFFSPFLFVYFKFSTNFFNLIITLVLLLQFFRNSELYFCLTHLCVRILNINYLCNQNYEPVVQSDALTILYR